MSGARVYGLIMAGGSGTRFWPVSRRKRPKQFLDLLGTGRTLVQDAYHRLLPLVSHAENLYISINQAHFPFLQEQLPEVKPSQMLMEPYGRNTAPCIAHAAYKIVQKDPSAILIVTPSDHYISDLSAFHHDLQVAVEAIEKKHPDSIFTVGVQPTRPDTGYGYIQIHQPEENYFRVKTFTEKPTQEVAELFVKSGEFLWNSGMFIFKVDRIIQAFQTLLPDLHELFVAHQELLNTEKEAEAIQSIYTTVPNISFDYGIMEKADRVYVVKASFTWNDLGTWRSLFHVLQEREQNPNVWIGKKPVFLSSEANITYLPKERRLAVFQHVNNLIIVETEDVLFVGNLEKEQAIRDVVKFLELQNWSDFL